jgi:hypothetical protein
MSVTAQLITVSEGEDLVQALTGAGGAWISAFGTVQGVELRVAGEGADPVRALRGRFTLVSLGGPGSGPWGVVLSRATDSGLELLGGELVRATSLGVVVAVQQSEPGAPTLRPPSSGSRPGAEPPKPPDGGSTWLARASAAARSVRAAEPEEEKHFPEPGDLVRHFAFGLCSVLIAEHDRLKIRDLDGPGRIREIHIDKLRVSGPTEQDGKRLFQLERKS